MFASNTCAVQMFELAFSRRICCSRVCIAMRSASLPRRSFDTPMIRPGNERLYLSRVVKKAAWGPPYPIGTPKRCAEPSTTSAPSLPGAFNSINDIISAATQASAFLSCTAAIRSVKSTTSPLVVGYWNKAPKMSWLAASWAGPMIMSKPNCSARVLTTSMVCTCTSSAIKKLFAFFALATRLASAMASAAAVASSSKEALAKSRPVKSIDIVWKFNSDSKRPCAISGW